MVSHYAPGLPVRLNAERAEADEAALAFGDLPRGGGPRFQLSAHADVVEAASLLFEGLRKLDRPGLRGIAVAPVPDVGLGRAINDRLQRAAAPREPR